VNLPDMLKKPIAIILIAVVIVSIVFAVLAYRVVVQQAAQVAATPTPVAFHSTPVTGNKNLHLPSVQKPSQILGIGGQPQSTYPGIGWVRIGYPTCGWGKLTGSVLKSTIQQFHKDGTRVLLVFCQGHNDSSLYNTKPLLDAAQGLADAVQCGNEEMKLDPAVAFLYIPPENFARFYDLCERAMHSVRPEIPVLLGSLDPHVGGVDYQPLVQQAQYLDQMQVAMNTVVHPGGHWDWHKQTLGLIDSWHNGWNSNGHPDANVNSLNGLFSFWAQRFHVDLKSGALGQHLWVVEGTGCFKGCGVNDKNKAQVAISHILALTTDVQTSLKYGVPFFFFSDKDFYDQGSYWPIGILDAHGIPKPLRQDLPMGSRSLVLTCPSGNLTVVDQLQLLGDLYHHCTLPDNYLDTLTQ
jgi:hypothetical protein